MSDIVFIGKYKGWEDKESARIFYAAMNPTFRTGIDINADPGAIAATEGMMTIFNSGVNRLGPNAIIIPQYLKLVTKVKGASGTDFSIRLATDLVNRYSSGGSQLTGNETYAAKSLTRRTSRATIYFGDLTLAAATSEKIVGQVTFHSATTSQIVGDRYMIRFGDPDLPSALVSAAAAQTQIETVQPVVLRPGGCLILQPFSTSAASTAAQFEVELGYMEINNS